MPGSQGSFMGQWTAVQELLNLASADWIFRFLTTRYGITGVFAAQNAPNCCAPFFPNAGTNSLQGQACHTDDSQFKKVKKITQYCTVNTLNLFTKK